MVGGIAELDVDHGHALEVVADRHLVGHAHAAVQLNSLLTNITTGFANLNFGARSSFATLAIFFV